MSKAPDRFRGFFIECCDLRNLDIMIRRADNDKVKRETYQPLMPREQTSPVCPQCGILMDFVRTLITPDQKVTRTFVCSQCELSVTVDADADHHPE